jgi:hypothetical protein
MDKKKKEKELDLQAAPLTFTPLPLFLTFRGISAYQRPDLPGALITGQQQTRMKDLRDKGRRSFVFRPSKDTEVE